MAVVNSSHIFSVRSAVHIMPLASYSLKVNCLSDIIKLI